MSKSSSPPNDGGEKGSPALLAHPPPPFAPPFAPLDPMSAPVCAEAEFASLKVLRSSEDDPDPLDPLSKEEAGVG